MFKQIALMLKITRSRGIMRRYFIVNGFDGALTMLGLIMGFYVSEQVSYPVMINACLGAAIALGMSGLTSAYISEVAEKRRELRELEQAMIKDLGDSAYGQAARWLPFLIAAVNSLSPLIISLIVVSPVWLSSRSFQLPFDPLEASLVLSLAMMFLLGVFLGRVSNVHWLWAGVRTLLIAIVTASLIFLLSPS